MLLWKMPTYRTISYLFCKFDWHQKTCSCTTLKVSATFKFTPQYLTLPPRAPSPGWLLTLSGGPWLRAEDSYLHAILQSPPAPAPAPGTAGPVTTLASQGKGVGFGEESHLPCPQKGTSPWGPC